MKKHHNFNDTRENRARNKQRFRQQYDFIHAGEKYDPNYRINRKRWVKTRLAMF